MAPGESPVFKEALVEVILRRSPVTTWVFVAKVTDELNLELNIFSTHDASVDLGRRLLDWARKCYYTSPGYNYILSVIQKRQQGCITSVCPSRVWRAF
jgi:hypothetical protein